MFDGGARPHPAQELYKSYLIQSQIFIGIYWQSYGWKAPDMSISGLEDEYNLSNKKPRLIYIKNPAPNRDHALTDLLDRIQTDNSSCYTSFLDCSQLAELIQNDLALLLTEHFEDNNYTIQSSANVLQHPPTNVPVPRNRLVNRKQELATARNLLLQPDTALITLTGAGGAGKSRLALQIGIDMREDFKDGVYLVRLESISDANLVIATIGETLGIREVSGSRPIDEMLMEFLRDKQMLLLLDNFEQVVAIAPFIAQLLEACPKMKSIVTSRVPLRLRAERVIPVPPLEVAIPEKAGDLNNLSQYAAVELFVQRAQAVKPNFSVTQANASAIAEICYRLDGLPLAIELAAARIRLLTPQELLIRMENRFDLLNNGPRDLPERQRTLRDAIDWSYGLLSDPEKKLFRRLSIFAGSWTLEAASSVCNVNDDISPYLDDTLISLLDNNLIIPLQETEDGERYGMLSTILEYASGRLEESGEADLMRTQLAQYYCDFIRMVEPRIRSSERMHWQQVMMQEFRNIRGVMEWILSSGRCLEIGQQIVITIGMLWVTSGSFTEGEKWCNGILSLSGNSTSVPIRSALLGIAGLVSWAKGEFSSARDKMDECLTLLDQLEIKTLADKHLLAQALIVRGMLASTTRDLATATKMLQRGIELFKATNDKWYEAIAFSWLGEVAIYENDRDRGKDLQNQSIRLAREQGDPWCLVPPLMSSAQVALVDRDLIKSRAILLEAITLLRKTGDQWSLSFALNELGHIALMEGELDQGCAYFLEGLTLANTLGNLRVLVLSLAGTAAIIARRSLPATNDQQPDTSTKALAARLCGAIVPYIDKPGVFIWLDTKMLYEESLAQVKSLVDEEIWNKSYSEGQNIPLGQAVATGIELLNGIVSAQSTADPINET